LTSAPSFADAYTSLSATIAPVLFVRFTWYVNSLYTFADSGTIIVMLVGIRFIWLLSNESSVSSLFAYMLSPLNFASITIGVLSVGVYIAVYTSPLGVSVTGFPFTVTVNSSWFAIFWFVALSIKVTVIVNSSDTFTLSGTVIVRLVFLKSTLTSLASLVLRAYTLLSPSYTPYTYRVVLFCGVNVIVSASVFIVTSCVSNTTPSASVIYTFTLPLTTSLLFVAFVRFTLMLIGSRAVANSGTVMSTSVGIKLILLLSNSSFISSLGLYTVSPLNLAVITIGVLSFGV